MTIVEFIEARVADDEGRRRRMIEAATIQFGGPPAYRNVAGTPERIERECAAKRETLKRYALYADEAFPDHGGGYASASEDAMRDLAAVYSDHPDYREDWAR